MELNDFIRETLVQIASGIEGAQEELKQKDSEAIINTNITIIEDGMLATGGVRKSVEYIEFDVAVLVSDQVGKKVGAGITVASVFKVGASGESTTSHGSESRIKFKIPMTYPMHKYEQPSD